MRATSEGPARTWGLWPVKGVIALGSDADLTLIDLAREGVIHGAELHGRSDLTPWEGRRTLGAAVATIVRGEVVMRDGELLGTPGGARSAVVRARPRPLAMEPPPDRSLLETVLGGHQPALGQQSTGTARRSGECRPRTASGAIRPGGKQAAVDVVGEGERCSSKVMVPAADGTAAR